MEQLHILFLPFMAHGHMIPVLHMAKLFTSRGLKTTIISTPSFSQPVKQAQDSGIQIHLITIKFPPENSRLPDHVTGFDQVMSDDRLVPVFLEALSMIQEPVEQLLRELNPDCLVSDMFLPWTADSAAKVGIPRLVFHGISYFSLCATEELRRHQPFRNVESDTTPFVVANLPHEVKMVRTELADYDLDEENSNLSSWMKQVREADGRSYGVLVNSFHELEPDYADHYRNVLGRKAWSIGPLSLWNNGVEAEREKKPAAINALTWLDSKTANSVVYVCFGSMADFSPPQLTAIANGLDESGQDFIWVVRETKKNSDEDDEEWMPEGFEERVKGRGLILRGWAPQVVILDHPAVGAFMTHCGWNSILEAVCAGVVMATWPLFAEQFYNEKLVTQVLVTGIPVGNKKWRRTGHEGVSKEAVAKAVRGVMTGESAAEMKRRAAECKEKARKAVGEGGSSYRDVGALIRDLSAYRQLKH